MTLLDREPITRWVSGVCQGDSLAGIRLGRACLRPLLALTRRRLGPAAHHEDAEDVALSAFGRLCQGLRDGAYEVQSRNELWALLHLIAARKARDARRRLRYQAVRLGRRANPECLDRIANDQPGPSEEAQHRELFDTLIAQLPDETLREVARLRTLGLTLDEIATARGCAPITIRRKLRIIRSLWSRHLIPIHPSPNRAASARPA